MAISPSFALPTSHVETHRPHEALRLDPARRPPRVHLLHAMSYLAALRAQQAAERRFARAEEKRKRELERLRREEQKLTALEQARLEVETYENRLAVLLSVHKEQGDAWDWYKISAVLPPPLPRRENNRVFAVMRGYIDPNRPTEVEQAMLLEKAGNEDAEHHRNSLAEHAGSLSEWGRMNALALRVIAGDPHAYIDVIREFSPFGEISDLGSSVVFSGVDENVIEGVLNVNGARVIPSEVKTLTASGKVSIKPMAGGRFQQIYQDYLCGCVLRVAREVFALLPLDVVILTARAVSFNSSKGVEEEQPVLSVAFTRSKMADLNFDRLDPSDTVESFLHRCDFKANRKTGAFQPIEPLHMADLPNGSPGCHVEEQLRAVQQLRREVQELFDELRPAPPANTAEEIAS